MTKKIRIGLVGVGHAYYFNQFPGLKKELTQKSELFRAFLTKNNVTLIEGGYIDGVDGALESVQKLVREDLDLLFIVLSTYVPSAIVAPYVLHIQIPHVLVAIQPLGCLDYKNTTTYMQLLNDDVCALPEITGVYQRLRGYVPEVLVAAAKQKERIQQRVDVILRAISAKTAFKYAKFGYLGHTYEGMYDMNTDPTSFTAQFGTHVQMLEMCELAKLLDGLPENEIERRIDYIERTFDTQDSSYDPLTDYIDKKDLRWSAQLSLVLDRVVENNHLTALVYYYKGVNHNLYERMSAGLIVGNTLLTSRGIPLAGEADLKTAAAMLIMNRIDGGGSFAEIHPFDIDDNVVLVGHDGPHNIEICEGKPILRKLKKFHGKAGAGIGVEFSLKVGPVTLLSISSDENGKFKMVAACGESLAGDIPQTGNTNTRVRFPNAITEFLEKWSAAAPTHHFALGIGNRLNELRLVAKFMKMKIEIIE